MTFYENLRDNVADTKIEQFGQAGVYLHRTSESYDNVSGTRGSPGTQEVPIKLLDLPLRDREFSEEVTARANAFFMISAKAFAENNVTPTVGSEIVRGNLYHKILAINTIGPGGVAVIYKMALTEHEQVGDLF